MKAKYQINDKIGADNRDALIERCWSGLTKIENESHEPHIKEMAFYLRYMLSTWYNDDRFYICDSDDKLE